MFNRRSVMALALASASAFNNQALARERAPKIFKRLGIQLYMVGPDLDLDLPGTLKAVADIGYREVETAGLHGRTPEQMRAELDRVGLACTSCHMSLEPILPGQVSLSDLPASIAMLKALGATNAVVPSFPFMQFLKERPSVMAALRDPQTNRATVISDFNRSITVDDWIKVAGQLNAVGAQLAPAGIRVAYHNHNIEFVKFPSGQSALDLLIAHSDPKLVDFELDVGWVAASGEDPVAVFRRHETRITQMHLKDLSRVTPNTGFQIESVDLGQGVLPWTALMGAISTSSVQHVYVEQEPPFVTSRLKSAAAGYAFIQPLMERLGV
jgi:sugar phosphate isomerase/epimerase